MGHNGTHAGEDELTLAFAAGATVRKPAKQAGLDEPTADCRWANAEFRRAALEAQRRMFDSTRGLLASLASKAVVTLERLMRSDKASEGLGAAKVVLELGPRLREATEFEEQINRFEDEADDGNQTPAGDEELILALAAGVSMPEAVEPPGPGKETGEPTHEGRGTEAGFGRGVSRARRGLLAAAVGRLASLGGTAVGVLERLMESKEPAIARRAAKAVLQLGPRLRESTELQERIRLLEGTV